MRLHQRELFSTDQTVGLRCECQCEHDEVSAQERIRQVVAVDHVVDAIHVIDIRPDHRDVAAEWLEQANQRLRNATTTNDGHPCPEQVPTGLSRPCGRR